MIGGPDSELQQHAHHSRTGQHNPCTTYSHRVALGSTAPKYNSQCATCSHPLRLPARSVPSLAPNSSRASYQRLSTLNTSMHDRSGHFGGNAMCNDKPVQNRAVRLCRHVSRLLLTFGYRDVGFTSCCLLTDQRLHYAALGMVKGSYVRFAVASRRSSLR
jgi:hypothetical protein